LRPIFHAPFPEPALALKLWVTAFLTRRD
jgi:hypothetical protein